MPTKKIEKNSLKYLTGDKEIDGIDRRIVKVFDKKTKEHIGWIEKWMEDV